MDRQNKMPQPLNSWSENNKAKIGIIKKQKYK